MNRKLFEDLSKSIKEAGKIRKGRAKASRAYKYNAVDIRKLRKSVKVSSIAPKRRLFLMDQAI